MHCHAGYPLYTGQKSLHQLLFHQVIYTNTCLSLASHKMDDYDIAQLCTHCKKEIWLEWMEVYFLHSAFQFSKWPLHNNNKKSQGLKSKHNIHTPEIVLWTTGGYKRHTRCHLQLKKKCGPLISSRTTLFSPSAVTVAK